MSTFHWHYFLLKKKKFLWKLWQRVLWVIQSNGNTVSGERWCSCIFEMQLQLQCCEHHKGHCIHLHCIGVAAEISETDIPKAWQIKPKLSARGKWKWRIGWTASLKQNLFKPNLSLLLWPARPAKSLTAFSEMGGGLIACFLLDLIYAITKQKQCCCGRRRMIRIHIIFGRWYLETVWDPICCLPGWKSSLEAVIVR